MKIRAERQDDFKSIAEVTEQAFRQRDECEIIERIRGGETYVPELSLVAEENGRIVGHIRFSRTQIVGNEEYETLILGPIAVLPAFQNQGIGAELIIKGLNKARERGFNSVVLVGHPAYYPRFGFEKASKWGITCSFEVPDEVCMAVELRAHSLMGKPGIIQFPKEFGLE
jgi:predicted N-acetyltransferase YhbS